MLGWQQLRARERGNNFVAFVLGIIILLTLGIYWPGLKGTFHFDDFANINKLSDFGGLDDLASFFAFLLGGVSGPTGRPVSLLSFLLNDIAWPSQARPFLYTNLLFHALNGLLLFWVLYRLLRPIEKLEGGKAVAIATIATAIWVLHPLHVSTVLYVVQRMALLSTTFTLLSLLSYLVGREKLLTGKSGAYLWMTLSVMLFMPLSVLSKENGALVPLLIVILEATVIRILWPIGPLPEFKWRLLFLYGPCAVLFAYLGHHGLQGFLSEGGGIRDFTTGERLLTQSRVLLDYLAKLFFPRMQSGGLFTEFTISRSVFDPPTTLISLLVIGALLLVALGLNRAAPVASAAILFFFAGHLLESSVLMLELYFEHRNYLPSLFLFLPLGWFLVQGPLVLWIRLLVLVAFVVMLSFLTWQRASLWGDPVGLTFTWAQESPHSSRAQRLAALKWGHLGRPDKSLEVLDQARENIPNSLSIQIHYLMQKCKTIGATQDDVNRAIQAAVTIPDKVFDLNIMQWLLTEMAAEECKGIDSSQVLKMLKSLEHNPGLTSVKYRIRLVYHIEGVVRLMRGEGEKAYDAFKKCYDVIPNLPTVMQQVGLLATYGHFGLALQHLENAEKIEFNPDWRRRSSTLDYPSEIRQIKTQLQKDLEKAKLLKKAENLTSFGELEGESGKGIEKP